MPVFLIVTGIILIILNVKAIYKEKNSFKGMLQVKREKMTEAEERIGELRNEFAETILDLQKEILQIKEVLSLSSSVTGINTKVYGKYERNKESRKNEDIKPDKSIKINEVGKLLQSGVSVEEICDRLKIGKGEVLLIKELYIR